jgi:NhaP-type Na+/H+ or K+/H+ antiporter
VACLCYFHLNSSIMNPVMEVASFFLWAVVPYWMAEAFHWSGIVAIVVMGFFMDIYLRPGGDHSSNDVEEEQHRHHGDQPKMGPGGLEYYSWDDDELGLETVSETKQPPPTEVVDNPNSRAPIVRLSREADEHVHFVAHILSSLSENAIFAYMGLFLFSSKYKWDAVLCSIGVTSCVVSRAIMVVISSWIIWYMHVFRQRAGCQRIVMSACEDRSMESNAAAQGVDPLQVPISKSVRALSNYKVQVVLILAGLRGAVSLALVENIPIYNGVTGIGSKNKPLIKAMTSSSIIFTIFVLGGGAYYILKWLDISSDDMLIKSHGKSEAYNSSLFCGASTDLKETLGEMELSVRSLSRTSQHSAHSQPQLEQSSSQSRGGRTFVPLAMLE